MSFHYSPKIITDGLVLYLDAANPLSYVSGTTSWLSINRIPSTGVLTNGPTFNSGNGGSIVFDGTNDYVELTNNSPVQFAGLSEITLEAVIQPTSFSGSGNRFIYAQFLTPGSTMCGIYLNTSGKFLFGYRDNIQNNSGAIKSVTSNTTLNLNTTYHVTATFKAGVQTTLYINGIYDAGSIQSNPISSLTPDFIRIGRLFTDGFDFYKGNIYVVKTYKRALSSIEVLQNYNATKTRFGL
jgi:hypothetical protein